MDAMRAIVIRPAVINDHMPNPTEVPFFLTEIPSYPIPMEIFRWHALSQDVMLGKKRTRVNRNRWPSFEGGFSPFEENGDDRLQGPRQHAPGLSLAYT